ncbi:MAG: YraN family protein [Cyanobacteriota bacterium]
MVSKKNKIARQGELLATEYLINKGYKILQNNWRYSRTGEIDIIAQKNQEIIFVEVKTRSTTNCGEPFESIDENKQQQIYNLAEIYISKNQFPETFSFRFDAIGVILKKIPEITHLENAYQL